MTRPRSLSVAEGRALFGIAAPGDAEPSPPLKRERAQPEREFTEAVVDYFLLRGWLVVHFDSAEDPRRGGRMRTAMMGVAGFPDIYAIRVGAGAARVVVAELKIGHHRPSTKQARWLAAHRVAGHEVHVWAETDWAEIERVAA